MRSLLAVLSAWILAAIAPAQVETIKIGGRVISAASSAPVPGARVAILGRIRRGLDRLSLQGVETDADGRFSVIVEKSQARVLTVMAPGYANLTETLNVAAPLTALSLRLEMGRSLSGLILEAETLRPLEGVVIANEEVRAQSDSEGRFVLDGLLTSQKEVELSATLRGYVPKELTVTREDTELRCELDAGHALWVKVVNDEGDPLFGASVDLRFPMAAAYSGLERGDYRATTDAGGVAVVRGIMVGHPVLPEVSLEGYVTTQGAVVSTEAGAQSTEVRLSKGCRTRLIVLDGHGRPVEGAEIRILPLIEPLLDFGGFIAGESSSGILVSGTTGSDGSAAFERLPAEVVVAEIGAPGLLPKKCILRPTRNEPTPRVVLLEVDPSPPRQDIPWSLGTAEAFEESLSSGLPILFSMAMDGERANEWMANHHFHDPEIIRVARELPCVLSNVFGANGATAPGVDHREVDGVCTRYGAIPCAAHQSTESYCVANFIPPGTPFQVPQQILVAPNAEIIAHRVFYLSEREWKNILMRALRHCRPEIAARHAKSQFSALLGELVVVDAQRQREAVNGLAKLINAGDEFAVALLSELSTSFVPAGLRLELTRRILPEALHLPASALRPLAEDPDPEVRFEAVKLLRARMATAEITDVLLSRVWDEDSDVALRAQAALGITQSDGQWHIENPEAKDRLAIFLELVSMLGPSALSRFDETVSTLSLADLAELARALGRRPRDPEACAALTRIAAFEELRSVAALDVLSRIFPTLVENGAALAVGLNRATSFEPLVRAAAIRLLAQSESLAAREMVKNRMNDAELEVCFAAAESLALAREEKALHIVLEALDDPFLRVKAERILRQIANDEHPGDAGGWTEWLLSRNLITRNSGDDKN